MAASRKFTNTRDWLEHIKNNQHEEVDSKSEFWGFKFETQRPASEGRVSWEEIPCHQHSRSSASLCGRESEQIHKESLKIEN